MIPQGTSILNPAYFEAQQVLVAGCKNCAELQAQVTSLFASLQAGKTAVDAQLALLNPILALLSAPSNPSEVITWIQNFITNFLGPYVVPITTYTTQLTQFATQITNLSNAINTAASKIPGCNVTIPPIT